MSISLPRPKKSVFATALATAVAAVAVGTLPVLPAHAATVSSETPTSIGAIGSSLGGSLTRTQILQRAVDWVNAEVPYNDSTAQGWSDSTVGGPYREDCSGFVSMAWGLTSSLTSQTLPSVATVIPTSQLQPGDALDYTAEHALIFDQWVDQSAGTFDYYYESSGTGHTIEAEGNFNDSTLDSWPTSDYEALRYNNLATAPAYLAASAPSSTVASNGAIAFYAIRSDGNVWGQSQSAAGGAFGGWQQLTSGGGFVGKPAVVQASSGAISVYARGANGSVWQGAQAQAGGAFTWTSLGGTTVNSDPSAVVLPNGAQAVYITGTDGNVWGQGQSEAGGAFGGWQQLTTVGTQSGPPAAVVAQNGTVQLFSRATNGSVTWGAQSTPSGGFGWTTLGGSTVTGNPTALLQDNGTIAVYATASDGNVWGQSQSAVGGAFGGWQQLTTGGGDVGAPAAILSSSGTPTLYVETAAGGVMGGTQGTDGTFSWGSLGGTTVDSIPSAVLTTSDTVAVYIASTDGHVWGDSQSAPSSAFTGWQQLN